MHGEPGVVTSKPSAPADLQNTNRALVARLY